MKKLLTIITAALLLLGSSSAWAVDYCYTDITFDNGSKCSITVYKSGEMASAIELRDVSGAALVSVQSGSCLQNHSADYTYVGWNDIGPKFSESSGVFTATLTWDKKFPKWTDNIGQGANMGSTIYLYCKFVGENNYGRCTVQNVNWEAICAAPEPTVSLSEGEITKTSIQVIATPMNFSGTPSYTWRYKQTVGGSYAPIAAATSTITQSGLSKATSYTFECTATYQDETDTKEIVIETADEKGDIDIAGVTMAGDLMNLSINGSFDTGATYTLVSDILNPSGLTFEQYGIITTAQLQFKVIEWNQNINSGQYRFVLKENDTKCTILNFEVESSDEAYRALSGAFKSATACTVPETEAEFPFAKTSLNQKTLAVSTTGNIKSVVISQNGEQKRYFEGSGATSQNVDISNLASGTYTVTLTAEGSGTLKVLNSVY